MVVLLIPTIRCKIASCLVKTFWMINQYVLKAGGMVFHMLQSKIR
jgi:hypothetical protein